MSVIPKTAKKYFLPKREGIDSLTLIDAPVPTPGDAEVLIKVHAVSLNYRDHLIANGRFHFYLKETLVPCSDMAGTIVRTGRAVDTARWPLGARVSVNFMPGLLYGPATPAAQLTALGAAADGVLAEYVVFPATALVAIPEHLSFEEASTLPCAGLTAYNALYGPVPIKAGDTVLVQGTGGVSTFALQLAKVAGTTIIATSGSDAKLVIARKLGAAHTINYRTTPAWDEEVLRITKGRGVDHVIEMGGQATLARSLRSVCVGGWIHEVGFVAQEESTESVDIATECLKKGLCLHGVQVGSVAQFEDLNRLITATQLHPVVDKVFTFKDARAAFTYLEAAGHIGKVVVKIAE